ncbi:MAG: phage tail spike protein [Clostridium paraputrificum]
MIEVYLKTNTNYEMNGDMPLEPSNCSYKSREYLLTIEHPFDKLERWKFLEYENVIKAEGKLYRIFNVVKSLDYITAYARPIFFDLIDTILLDVRPTNKTGQQALEDILKGTGFKAHSNISNVSTAYYIRRNIVEAILGDDENSFLNRWGGEVYLDNFDIYINDKIGADNGVRVEFGYNLNEIEENINIEEVATRIIPMGFDGLMLEGDTPWIDSLLIDKYVNPKMRVVKFDDVKVKESETDEEGFNTIEEARAELIKRCNKLYEEGIDKPQVNYKIDMINLANTTAYKSYIDLVKVGEGDAVTCYVKALDINVKTRVIDFEKDLITGDYIYLELGSSQCDFFNKQADIQNKVESILNGNGTVKGDKISGVINALDTKFQAMRDVAQPQQVRAMIFEDRVEDSPTFGCLAIGTMGFEIASSFKPGTKVWDFRTFGTGKGFVADCITTGILRAILLESLNGNTTIDLSNGKVKIKNGGFIGNDSCFWDLDKQQISGKNLLMDLLNGFTKWNHESDGYTEANAKGFFRNGRPYHNLITVGTGISGGSAGVVPKTVRVQLPDKFKNKEFRVICQVVDTQGGEAEEYLKRIHLSWDNLNKANATFDVTGYWIAKKNNLQNEKELQWSYIAIGG